LKRYGLILAGVFILLATLFIADHKIWFIDDRDHPDGVLLSEEFSAASEANRSQINVIAVTGGNWLALCLVGPGRNPQNTLLQFGRKNRIRVPTLQRFRSWLYVGNVPQGEIALVFVTGSYSVRSRRLLNLTGNPDFKSSCALRNDAGLTWKQER
jgi:hypothetical protein